MVATVPSGPVVLSKGGQERQPTCGLPLSSFLTAAPHTLAATSSLARPAGPSEATSLASKSGSRRGGVTGEGATLALLEPLGIGAVCAIRGACGAGSTCGAGDAHAPTEANPANASTAA